MKVSTVVIAVCLLVLGATVPSAAAGPRDLFLGYPSAASGTQTGASVSPGQPGAKLTIELKRGDATSYVAPTAAFHSGDRVRFHFAVNFDGYVAVVNEGSTGTKRLLFPYGDVSNRIRPTADYRLPKGDDWFVFDENPGKERLTFIMSTKPVQGLPSPVQPTQTSASTGGPATPTEEQEILNALNSRALANGKDLVLNTDGTDSFLLTSSTALGNPLGFTVVLNHQ